MIPQNVFTPDKYPEYTYVERKHGEHEKDLKFELKGSSKIISISGPSKSGKTMLLNNVVDKLDYNLITVHGSNINSITSLWDNALDAIDAPTNTEIVEGTQDETVKEGSAGIDISFANAGAGGSKREQDSSREAVNRERRGLKQITDIVNTDEFILYIDDAHYIDEEVHNEISEGIKEAYGRDLSVCVAFIPHRSDDLVRANPDLSGRIESIDIGYWNNTDLQKIGKKGFNILNKSPSELLLQKLARESIYSPHIMQKLCLELCKELEIYEKAGEMTPLQFETEDLKKVLRTTAKNFYYDYSTILEIISGETTNNNGRNDYEFPLRGEGDIYDVILRALSMNPPKLTLDRQKIIERVSHVCRNETPQSSNIIQTIQRMDKWVSKKIPENEHCFDWADDRNTLEIPDPYLIFCLRWSDTLNFEPSLQ